MKIDVVVTSTCRKTVEKTVESFLDKLYLSEEFNFIVNVDVKNPGYLPTLEKYFKRKNINDVHINHHPARPPKGQADAVNYLYNKLNAPYYFNLEDDWIFLKTINLDALIEVMEKNEDIDIIKLNRMRIPEESWLYHLSPSSAPLTGMNSNQSMGNLNLVKTHNWSFNPSLVRTATIKKMLPVEFTGTKKLSPPSNAEKYFCHTYDHMFSKRGAFFLGCIGDPPIIRDIGRNKWKVYRRRLKKFLWAQNS